MSRRARSPAPAALALALAPLLAGWQGSGKADGAVVVTPVGSSSPVTAGSPQYVSIDAVARVTNGRTRVVLVFVLPGDRDAVMTLDLDTDWGVDVSLSDPLVSFVYEELGGEGDTLFLAREGAGRVETVFRTSGAISLGLDARFEDSRAARVVGLTAESITLVPDVVNPDAAESAERAAPAGGSVTASSGGCEDDGYESGSASEGAWNSGASADSSGGCDGDSTDTSSDSGDGSGCEGDDVDSGSSSDDASASDSCDGDAAAAGLASTRAHRSRPRASLLAKLVAWLPYLVVLLPLGLHRRLSAFRKSR